MEDWLLLFALLALLAIARAVLSSAWFKGWIGERRVRGALSSLDENTYHVLNDVTLPAEDGTTQIDHVVVSPYGVFVIETKNMQGWIFGRERQAQWTQQIYRHKQRFQNPLRQNYKHTQTLIELLSLSREVVKPVIAFVGGASLRTEMPPNVTTGTGFLQYIKSHQEPVLSGEEVAAIVEGIQTLRLAPGLKTHRAHVQHVKQLQQQRARNA